MLSRGWDNNYFRERYRAVMDAKVYGVLKFSDFIDAERLYSRREAYALAEDLIRQRRDAISQIRFDEKELEREGLVDIQIAYARKRDEYKRKIGQTIEQRVRRVERFIKAADEQLKLEILSIVNQKGKIGNDPHWRQILHMFAADVLEEVEKLMKML